MADTEDDPLKHHRPQWHLMAQKVPEAEYPKEVWFAALNAYQEIGNRQQGTTSDRVNAIADAIMAERERCKRIAVHEAATWKSVKASIVAERIAILIDGGEV